LDGENGADLHQQVLVLIGQVGQSDLAESTKRWLLDRLGDIAERLESRRNYSASEIGVVSDALLGGLRQKAERIADLRNSSCVRKVLAFIVALDLAINLAANTKELLGGDATVPEPASSSSVVWVISETNIYPTPMAALPQGESTEENPAEPDRRGDMGSGTPEESR
jgi:hypothetical protein